MLGFPIHKGNACSFFFSFDGLALKKEREKLGEVLTGKKGCKIERKKVPSCPKFVQMRQRDWMELIKREREKEDERRCDTAQAIN